MTTGLMQQLLLQRAVQEGWNGPSGGSWVTRQPPALQALCCQGDSSDRNSDQRAQFSPALQWTHVHASVPRSISFIEPVDVRDSVSNVLGHLWSVVALEGPKGSEAALRLSQALGASLWRYTHTLCNFSFSSTLRGFFT